MAARQDKESLLEEVWGLKKALQAARESNRLLTLQNKHMVADLKNLEEHVIDLQSAKRDQRSPLRSGTASSSAEQSALVARLKQQAREIKSQQVEIASELAQVKGSTRAHRFREIEEENRALYAEINRLRGQKALFEKERSKWKRKVEGLEKRLAERRPGRKEPARGPSPVDSIYSRGHSLGRQRDASPSKSSKRELEMETIRSKCDRLQESNQRLTTELQEVKEYVRFLSQASGPSDQFQTRPASPQPSDWCHLAASEPSNFANSTDVRTMAGETRESEGPARATSASGSPTAGDAEANGKTNSERKGYYEESAQKSRPTGVREQREESKSESKSPELDRVYGFVESSRASILVGAQGTERVSTRAETEGRWRTEDRMSVKHVAAEERRWATGTERNDDSVTQEESASTKRESSSKRVGFALDWTDEATATEWRKAERTETEPAEAGWSLRDSARQKGEEVVEAVRNGRQNVDKVAEGVNGFAQNLVESAENRVGKGGVEAARDVEKVGKKGMVEVAKQIEEVVENRADLAARDAVLKTETSDGSGYTEAKVGPRAVETVGEGMADRRRSQEKGVRKGAEEIDSEVVWAAETIVVQGLGDVVKAGRNLEQSAEGNAAIMVEDARKADSSAEQSVKSGVERATGAGRNLETAAERETAERVEDGRTSSSRAEQKAENAWGAVQPLGASILGAVSEKRSREERSEFRDEGSVFDEATPLRENRSQRAAVASGVLEASDRGVAGGSALANSREGETRGTEVEVPATARHALGPGVTSSVAYDLSDDSPPQGTGSLNRPLKSEAKPNPQTEALFTGLKSEMTSGNAFPSDQEKASVRSSAESLSSPLDSDLRDGGLGSAESERERLQERVALPDVITKLPNPGLTERTRVNDPLPIIDSLPAVLAPGVLSQASKESGSSGTNPADRLPTDQRTNDVEEVEAETREPPTDTKSGERARIGEGSAESDPHTDEHLEEILDGLDLDLDGLEVAGEASARSAAAAARAGEVFEVHHEESHAQLFTPDETDIAEEAW